MRKYVTNKTLPPKELNMPRKKSREALLISMIKKNPLIEHSDGD